MDELALRIAEEIKTTPSDFATVTSIAAALSLSGEEVRGRLPQLVEAGLVRRPVMPEAKFDDWCRWVARGLTRAEKWSRVRAIVTFAPMRDNF